MCEKLKDGCGAAKRGDKLFRVLLKTPRQRELSKRNAEIASYCKRECDKGSATMYVYDVLSKMYGLSANQIGTICREGGRYA